MKIRMSVNSLFTQRFNGNGTLLACILCGRLILWYKIGPGPHPNSDTTVCIETIR